MKLGLLADIHEHVEHLQRALGRFREEKVEQVVVLGDLFEMGTCIDETCRLLEDAGAIGVWGNHDFGLCSNPEADAFSAYDAAVLKYMSSLRPRLEVAGCQFTHVEPWLNPENMLDLWYFEGPPDDAAKLGRIFAAAGHRIFFTGHSHQWLLATPSGVQPWQGERAIRLNEGRYFVAIGALCDGCYATFDTESCELTPFHEEKAAQRATTELARWS